MKSRTSFFSLAVLVGSLSLPLQAETNLDKLTTAATAAVDAFKHADASLTDRFKNAAGYAIFPQVSKGGFVVGGARGDGLVYAADQLIGRATLTQATIGAQIGGQIFREVIFFENSAALESFKQSNLEMSAQVGAVAAAEGAAKNAKYRDGVLVFTQPIKGLMAEASVGGQKLKFEALP